jgi:hypothetical protein
VQPTLCPGRFGVTLRVKRTGAKKYNSYVSQIAHKVINLLRDNASAFLKFQIEELEIF